MKLGIQDRNKVVNRYTERFKEYGYSPKTLGWDKGKQPLRFSILSKILPSTDKFSVMDIGCGFGDLYAYLFDSYGDKIQYFGIDIVPALIQEGMRRFSCSNAKLICGDFLEMTFDQHFDCCLGSGLFNFNLRRRIITNTLRMSSKKLSKSVMLGLRLIFFQIRLIIHTN